MTTSGISTNLYDLNKELNVAIKNGCIFNRINKLTVKFYSHFP